jgi:hypothetical protein
MLIKGKKKINTNNITIKIDNNTLEQVTTYKYLGVHIDCQMNWKMHFNYIINKTRTYIPLFMDLDGLYKKSNL